MFLFFLFNVPATTEIYTYGQLFPYTSLFRSPLCKVSGIRINSVAVTGEVTVSSAKKVGAATIAPPMPKRRSIGLRPKRSARAPKTGRSEEHTSELQSLMRISYAVFCLKKKKNERQNE